MKRKIAEILKNKKIAAGCTAAALALIIGSVAVVQDSKVPEFPVYTDPIMEVTLEEEETPLASAPTVKTTTKKNTSTKKVTMKSASKKTYTKQLPTTKKTTTATSNTAKAVVETETTVAKAVTEKYTKKSKVKTVTTVTTTTVTTTTTEKAPVASSSNNNTSSSASTAKPQNGKYSAQITQIAPMMDSRVLSAYNKLEFTVDVDSSVSYAGYFDAATRKIILKQADDTIYHELGHFVSFITGNTDKSAAFQSVYSQEKSKFTGINKAYATQNSSEYFAESMKDYILQPAALKSSRPLTYQAIADALNKITDAQVTKVLTIYGPVWNR